MKNIMKKFLTIIITLSLALIPMVKVNAASETIQIGPSRQAGKYIAGVTFSYKSTTDGKPLYCINQPKNSPHNITADLVKNSSMMSGGIVYILRNGYPEKSITGDKEKDYYITQTAIWWYLDEVNGSHNLGDQFKETGSDPDNLRPVIKNLALNAVKHKNDAYGISETKLVFSTTDKKMTLSGDYYVSQPIVTSERKNVEKYTVSVQGAPEGTLIEVGNNHYKGQATITGSESFVIKVPATAVDSKNLEIKVAATATGVMQYAAYHYHPRNNDMQDVSFLEKAQGTATASITLEAVAVSKVIITKLDATTRQPLAGAVLVLKDSRGKELSRWTSSTKSHIFKNLAKGTYTVEEKSAPNGYKVNKTPVEFTITDQVKNIKVDIENSPKKVVVNITKVDQATQQPLAGAILQLKDAKGVVVYRWTSVLESEVITDLDNGTYTIEEVSAPEGYLKNDKVYTFTIDDDHLSHQILFENSKEVYVPDTASVSSMLIIIIGIVITGFGLNFVYKNGKKAR